MPFVRLILYSLLSMALGSPLDYPSVNWRDAVAKILNAGSTYQPSASGITAPNVYQSQGTPPPSYPGPSALGRYDIPDYSALIQADPGYTGVNAQANAEEASAQSARANAVRRALIQFGIVPQGWQSGYGDADQATLDAAAQNPFSTMHQLTDARSRGSADLAAVLGARGMLSSGALTGGEQLLQRNYDASQADASNRLLAALGGYESDYAGAFRSLEGQKQSAFSDAAGRAASMYPARWIPAPSNSVSYADIGYQADPILGAPLTSPTISSGAPGAITPDMVAPPDTSFLGTVQPPTLKRNRRFDLTNSYVTG